MVQIVKKCDRFQSGQCSGPDSKQTSPEWKFEVLPLAPSCLVECQIGYKPLTLAIEGNSHQRNTLNLGRYVLLLVIWWIGKLFYKRLSDITFTSSCRSVVFVTCRTLWIMSWLTGVVTFSIQTEMFVSLAVVQSFRTLINIYIKQNHSVSEGKRTENNFIHTWLKRHWHFSKTVICSSSNSIFNIYSSLTVRSMWYKFLQATKRHCWPWYIYLKLIVPKFSFM